MLLRYVLAVYDIVKQDLMDMAVEAVKPDMREAVMTTYEQIKQEGRQRFSSATCHPSSVICHLSSVICHLPSVIRFYHPIPGFSHPPLRL